MRGLGLLGLPLELRLESPCMYELLPVYYLTDATVIDSMNECIGLVDSNASVDILAVKLLFEYT